jgi:response regulator of citrate/malate metabolism
VIASKKYDLIFLDIKLPGFSGLDVLRQIKKDNNAQDVIMVSAYNDGDVADMSRKAGAVNYITKPVYMENFQKLLKEIFEKKGKYFVKG